MTAKIENINMNTFTVIVNTNQVIAYDRNKYNAMQKFFEYTYDIYNLNDIKRSNEQYSLVMTNDKIYILELDGLFSANVIETYIILTIDDYKKNDYIILTDNKKILNTSKNLEKVYEFIKDYIKNKYKLTEDNNYRYNRKILMCDNGGFTDSIYFSINTDDLLTLEEEIFLIR